MNSHSPLPDLFWCCSGPRIDKQPEPRHTIELKTLSDDGIYPELKESSGIAVEFQASHKNTRENVPTIHVANLYKLPQNLHAFFPSNSLDSLVGSLWVTWQRG
jgi:hypothetical protein